MFSVTKTELNVFPLWTRNVWPTKSGVTIERRDQVLIGFFAPELFILSIFSRRCDSTKGPFFNDLAINVKFVSCPALSGHRRHGDGAPWLHLLLCPSPFQNEPITRLMFRPCFKSFRQLPPRAHRVMPAAAAF